MFYIEALTCDVLTECPRQYRQTTLMLMLVQCYVKPVRIRLLLHRHAECQLDNSAERQKLPGCTDLIRNQALHQFVRVRNEYFEPLLSGREFDEEYVEPEDGSQLASV